MMIQEMLQVENVFHLEVIGEGSDTQLSLSWRTLDEKKKETDVCMGCGTFQMNEKVGGLVEKLVGVKKEVVVKEEPPKKIKKSGESKNPNQMVLYGKLIPDKKNPTNSHTKWFSYGNDTTDQKYIGDMKNGLPDGQGSHTFPNGDKYIGEFRNGKKHGYGKMTYASGNIYLGRWEKNKRWGWGKITYTDGYEWKGDWFNDCRMIPCKGVTN